MHSSQAQPSVTRQNIQYKLLNADIETHKGFVGVGGGAFLGGVTGLGLSIEARAQYDLTDMFTLWFQGHRELVGVGNYERGPLSYKAKPLELNAGVMYPIIPGQKKDGDVKIQLESSYSYSGSYDKHFKAKGEVKSDLMAKAGLYHYGSADASNTGITLGLTRRKREHAEVEYGEYIYPSHYDKQLYFDVILTPITSLPEPGMDANDQVVELEKASVIGARIGYQKIFYGTRSINYEISARPYSDFYIITLAARFTFGVAL